MFYMSSFQSAAAPTEPTECLKALWPFFAFRSTTGLSMLYRMLMIHTRHSCISVLCVYLFSSVFLVFCCCVKLFRPTCPVENNSFINKVLFFDQQNLCLKSSHLYCVSRESACPSRKLFLISFYMWKLHDKLSSEASGQQHLIMTAFAWLSTTTAPMMLWLSLHTIPNKNIGTFAL